MWDRWGGATQKRTLLLLYILPHLMFIFPKISYTLSHCYHKIRPRKGPETCQLTIKICAAFSSCSMVDGGVCPLAAAMHQGLPPSLSSRHAVPPPPSFLPLSFLTQPIPPYYSIMLVLTYTVSFSVSSSWCNRCLSLLLNNYGILQSLLPPITSSI